MFKKKELDFDKIKNMSIENILKDVIIPDHEKDVEDNINNRKPETYSELMAILKKEHEETFKDITLEAQLDKFVDEFEEYKDAENPLDEARELADLLIVAAGVARFAPRFAKDFMVDKIIDMIDESDEYGKGLVTHLALEKSLINKQRDWSKKGGKYQHK